MNRVPVLLVRRGARHTVLGVCAGVRNNIIYQVVLVDVQQLVRLSGVTYSDRACLLERRDPPR